MARFWEHSTHFLGKSALSHTSFLSAVVGQSTEPSFDNEELTFELAMPELAVAVITFRDRIFGDAVKDHLLGVVSCPVRQVITGCELTVPLMSAGMRLLDEATVTVQFDLVKKGGGKIVKGTEIDTEFNNIATAVAT